LAYEESDGDYLESKEKRDKIESNTKKMSKVNQYLKKFYTSHSDDEGNAINESENIVYENLIKEDLRVWFGTKKKPKGSKQPQGPWVNICRKVDGKHPTCGRPDADPKGYPKCRAKSVASKMTDSQKKSACAKKRKAEKKDTQTGKGQKPVYSSYKPRKESVEFLPPLKLVKLAGKILYESKKQGITENLTIIKNLYNRVPFSEKMIN
jgi:hypothetical protein